MEAISLKLENTMLSEIDKNLKKHRYATRTEFIRDAIRKQLSDLEKEQILKNIGKLQGISKRKTTDRQLHEARERAFAMLEKKFK
tara:strand:+ start:2018 stop:2272 length:255 start_codon:yes stop_codon:yes gene_type:complete